MSRRLETGPTACSLKANIQEEYPLQNFEEMLRTRDEETRHVNFVLGDCEIGADDQQVYLNAHIAESGKQTKEESLHLTNESFRIYRTSMREIIDSQELENTIFELESMQKSTSEKK